jgi:uncharacterized membrane protein YhaH (DUF805 family)
VESFHYLALRPLRHYADFRGRSRRSELIAFYLLTMLAGLLLSFPAPALGFRAKFWLETGLDLALACPVAALMVRRLHDSGRSGGWVLLFAPAAGLDFWRDCTLAIGFQELSPFESSMPALAVGLLSLGLLVLLLWNDDPEENRFGPNPRLDAPPGEAQPL